MTDDSKFVLRWEIDDAVAKFATGKVVSEVFEEGGFEWNITAEDIEDNMAAFTVRCDSAHDKQWKCEVDIGFEQHGSEGDVGELWTKERVCFNENGVSWVHEPDWCWSGITYGNWLINDTVIFELDVNIISLERIEQTADLDKFAAPNGMSNVILKIGDEKLHVSKEEFVDLLHVIYPGRFTITDATVIHVLKLGDRFQMERVISLAETHLRHSKRFKKAQKLRLADQFRLGELRDSCLKSYKNSRDLGSLQSTTEYDSFSADMNAAICDRFMSLVNDGK